MFAESGLQIVRMADVESLTGATKDVDERHDGRRWHRRRLPSKKRKRKVVGALRLGLRPRSGHSTRGWPAMSEPLARPRRAKGESNGGGGSRTRVRKACRPRTLHA